MKIHQITCPPYHGKGECDGHGAVIKRKARLYLLTGKWFNLNWIEWLTENNHIETVKEFGEFINENINNATAIQVSISTTDLNTGSNVTNIEQITKNYEHVWMPNSETSNQKFINY